MDRQLYDGIPLMILSYHNYYVYQILKSKTSYMYSRSTIHDNKNKEVSVKFSFLEGELTDSYKYQVRVLGYKYYCQCITCMYVT